METKFQTLQIIYDMVKNEIRPTVMNILPNEIISRLHFPWDEIMQHLDELHNDGLIIMKHSLVVVINITEKGFNFMLQATPAKTH